MCTYSSSVCEIILLNIDSKENDNDNDNSVPGCMSLISVPLAGYIWVTYELLMLLITYELANTHGCVPSNLWEHAPESMGRTPEICVLGHR